MLDDGILINCNKESYYVQVISGKAFFKGSSGTIDYQTYQKEVHIDWTTGGTVASPGAGLTVPLQDVMNTRMTTASPYNGETAYNPDTDLAELLTLFNSYSVFVGQITDEDTTWTSYNTKALNNRDSIAESGGSDIDAATDAFEGKLQMNHRKNIGSFAGGMADINAINSSAYVWGLGLMEMELQRNVANFRAGIELSRHELKVQTHMRIIEQLMTLVNFKLSHFNRLVDMKHRQISTQIVSKKEEQNTQIEFDVQDANWDMETFRVGGAFLGAIGGGGGMISANQPSRLMSGLAGAAGGAAAGAQIGGAFGPQGATLGGAIGAGAGLIGGLFS